MKTRTSALLWTLAVLLAAGIAYYQRRTGPTTPQRGSFSAGGEAFRHRLSRRGITGEELRVAVPAPGPGWTGTLRYRRWPTDDPLSEVVLARDGEILAAGIPSQPPAGKVEYHLVLSREGETVRVPADAADDPIARFKGSVPALVLAPHILMMFLSLIVGVRAGLGALLGKVPAKLVAFTVLALTAGGMVLGPIVQKHAFGEYWTGWPLGHDLTDNKTLLMWGAWLAAGLALLVLPARRDLLRRVAVTCALVVMIGVYLIPHSARGSELDYEAGEIRTGILTPELVVPTPADSRADGSGDLARPRPAPPVGSSAASRAS